MKPRKALKRWLLKWRAFVAVLLRFWPFIERRRGRLALAMGFALAFTATRLLEPWPLKLIIDNVLLEQGDSPSAQSPVATGAGDKLSLLYLLVGAILVLAFVRGLLYFRQRMLMSRLAIDITADLRLALYKHIHYLSPSFHDRRRTGDLLVRLTSDIRLLRRAFIRLPQQLGESVLLMVGMAIVMFFMDWQLTLLALGLLPMIALMVRRYRRPMKRAIRQQREREGQIATLATEALGAIKVVQGFRREDDEIERFGGANRADRKAGVKAAKYEAKLRWSSDVAIAIITAAIVLLAARRILSGSLSVGDLIVFVAYLRVYAGPLQRVSRITQGIVRATSGGERILQILDMQPTVTELPDAISVHRVRGEIAFEGVSFAYDEQRPALRNINLRVDAGEHVALIGATGAGKSTLVSLIPRFYDPTQGRVCLDRRDIRDYTLDSLRGQMSLVFQEPILFATSVAENIAYGKVGATMEEVVDAATRAKVDGIIRGLHDGYETVIGERGGTLSGGQRQCVAIARAMIRDTPVVILDELTVGLDPKSAAQVTMALDQLVKGRTVIAISHDQQTSLAADRVVVLHDGAIVPDGGRVGLLAHDRSGMAHA